MKLEQPGADLARETGDHVAAVVFERVDAHLGDLARGIHMNFGNAGGERLLVHARRLQELGAHRAGMQRRRR